MFYALLLGYTAVFVAAAFLIGAAVAVAEICQAAGCSFPMPF